MFESRYIYHTRTTGETRVWRRPWGRKRGILIIIFKNLKKLSFYYLNLSILRVDVLVNGSSHSKCGPVKCKRTWTARSMEIPPFVLKILRPPLNSTQRLIQIPLINSKSYKTLNDQEVYKHTIKNLCHILIFCST